MEDKWVCSQKAVKDDGLEKEEEERFACEWLPVVFCLGR